jgi:hypothetical protein
MFSHNFASVSLATLMSVLSWPAHAQAVCNLAVVKVADLRFGSWVVVAGGTLTVSPSTNLRSGTANVVTPSQINSSVGAAQFTVTGSGKGRKTYSLTLTTPINVTSNAETMTLGAFTASPSISVQRSTTCNKISETINVGATLQVGTLQAPGSYSSANTIVLLAQ